MKILHLTGELDDAGGVLSVLRNLHETTYPWGWRHAVWVNRKFVQKRTPALDLRYNRYSCAESAQHWKLIGCALLSWPGLNRLLKSETFDIVHAHTRGSLLLAMAIASRLGRRVVYTNHNYARRKAFYRRIAQKPNIYTVLLTPNMARYYGLASQPPKISIISACCADRFFSEPLVQRRTPVSPSDIIRLAGVGTIQPYKQWHLGIEALAALTEAERRRFELSIWGPILNHPEARDYDRQLRQAVAQHRLESSLKFRGSTNEIGACLRASDWLFLPSTNEPCSVALCEALALGLPALVSASGGNVDIMESGKTGLLFEPNNSQDLARQLRSILEGRATPGSPAVLREAVRERSATTIARQYEQLYRQVMAG